MNPIILLSMGDSIDKIFYSLDMWIFHFFGSMQNTVLTYVAKFFTSFGDEAFVIPMVIVGIVMCFFKKTRKFGFALMFAIIVGTLVTNIVLKPMALRIRPYNTLQGDAEYWAWYVAAGALSESDYSFPSGHTTAAFEMATALFLCFFNSAKKPLDAEGGKGSKKIIAFIFPVLALCTAGSRIYLMVHYPTDVIAGMIAGICAGVIGYFLMKLVMLVFTKTGLDDKIDVEKLFKKLDEKKRNVIGVAAIIIATCAIFLSSFIPVLSEGGEQTCAYEGEYNCNNAARVDDEKYPAIDGKEYCKIHWKQLMGESE